MKRLYYSTQYDDYDNICGYVIPKRENENFFFITESQYQRCLENRRIGGVAGVAFHTEKQVLIIGRDI